MKRFNLTLFAILCLSVFTACRSSQGDISKVSVEIGESVTFTQQEVEQAVQVVKEKFQTFENCTLNRLQYDDEESNTQVASYLESGNGSVNGATAENTLVLCSEFHTQANADGAWEPDTDYSWIFILIRDNPDSAWVIDDMGY